MDLVQRSPARAARRQCSASVCVPLSNCLEGLCHICEMIMLSRAPGVNDFTCARSAIVNANSSLFPPVHMRRRTMGKLTSPCYTQRPAAHHMQSYCTPASLRMSPSPMHRSLSASEQPVPSLAAQLQCLCCRQTTPDCPQSGAGCCTRGRSG